MENSQLATDFLVKAMTVNVVALQTDASAALLFDFCVFLGLKQD